MAKHVQTDKPGTDRPAFEITQKMIDVGVRELRAWLDDVLPDSGLYLYEQTVMMVCASMDDARST